MVEYDAHTALIVVDMQNDFADQKGSLYVTGAEQVIPVVNTEIERARSAGALVVYTRDWHPEVTPHFAKDGGIWPVHCVADTWGAAFHPDVVVEGPTIFKGTGGEDGYSGFAVRDPRTGATSSTGLDDLLEAHEITGVVVTGLALDYCVKATALDAAAAGLSTRLLRDGTRAVNLEEGDDRRALEELEEAGVEVV